MKFFDPVTDTLGLVALAGFVAVLFLAPAHAWVYELAVVGLTVVVTALVMVHRLIERRSLRNLSDDDREFWS